MMRARTRFVGLLFAFMLLMAIGGAVGVSPAYAATCYGSTCNGKDPQGTTCQWDAYRVFGMAYPMSDPRDGGVELWYSASCNANWARVVRYRGTQSGTVWLEQNGNKYPADGKPINASGNTWWSPMRDGSYVTRACGTIGAFYNVGCSPWA